MDIECMRAVLAAYTYGNYFEAAYQLAMEYSTFAKKISKVEKELDVNIFQRAIKGRPLTLTVEGRALIHQLQKVVAEYDILEKKARELRLRQPNSIRIGYWRSLSTFGEHEVIANFFSNHPEYQLSRMISSPHELCNALLSGKLDCIFITDTHMINTKLISQDLFHIVPLIGTNELNLLVSPRHPLAHTSELMPEDFHLLAKENFIFDSRQNKDMPSILLQFLGVEQTAGKTMVDYSDSTVAYNLVKSGYGIMPKVSMKYVSDKDLHCIRVHGWDNRFTLHLVYPRGRKSDLLRQFVRYTLDFYAGDLPETDENAKSRP